MGSVEAFSTEVPVSISFEPIVQDNGDIILQANSMSLGLLRLPEDRILQYVSSRVELPDWITINPKEEHIYVALTQMELKSNFRVKAQQIDLENDIISFRIKVPNKTLGLCRPALRRPRRSSSRTSWSAESCSPVVAACCWDWTSG